MGLVHVLQWTLSVTDTTRIFDTILNNCMQVSLIQTFKLYYCGMIQVSLLERCPLVKYLAHKEF